MEASPHAPATTAVPARVTSHSADLERETTAGDALTSPAVAFLVFGREGQAHYPSAIPGVLIEPALAHRYQDVLAIDLVDPPSQLSRDPAVGRPIPVLVIAAQEVVFYPQAQRVMIVQDHRTR